MLTFSIVCVYSRWHTIIVVTEQNTQWKSMCGPGLARGAQLESVYLKESWIHSYTLMCCVKHYCHSLERCIWIITSLWQIMIPNIRSLQQNSFLQLMIWTGARHRQSRWTATLLNEYIRGVVKPTIKNQLVQGITQFWQTVIVAKCEKYVHQSPQQSSTESSWTERCCYWLLIYTAL